MKKKKMIQRKYPQKSENAQNTLMDRLQMSVLLLSEFKWITLHEVSKYGVFSGPNTGKYGPEKTPYLALFT